MPAFVERRQPRFTNQITLAKRGRVREAIYLRPQDFDPPHSWFVLGASAGTQSGCGAGSMSSACLVYDISGSVTATGCAVTFLPVPALNMGAGASPASSLWAVTTFPVPPQADTSGSIVAYVDWTYGDDPATTGSKTRFRVNIAYLNGHATTPTTIRTAASVGGATNASYVGTACGIIQSTCLGVLPSFGASDSLAIAQLRVGASAAGDSGVLSTGCVFVFGVRLEYLVKQLGRYSTE